MDKICERDKCTACFACVNACPKQCIAMTLDEDMCYRATIDNSICINCGKCLNICPNNNMTNLNEPICSYAAYSKDRAVNEVSTSGGVAATIAKAFIENTDVVYGAAIKVLCVRHIRCNTLDDLKKIQGSKYVHSHINDSFKKVSMDLEQGLKVLFIGTPCQIAGLKNYISQNDKNLYTIDIVCHGTPDREVFIDYSKHPLGEKSVLADKVTFRDGEDYLLKYFDKNDNLLLSKKARESYYLNHFLDGYSFRKNCYSCNYAQIKRTGDITLGDFWGLNDSAKSDIGTNLVLINTKKGEELFNLAKSSINFEKKEIELAIKSNDQLRHPAVETTASLKFIELCKIHKSPFAALKKCYMKKSVLIRIREIIYANKSLYTLLGKIPVVKDKL